MTEAPERIQTWMQPHFSELGSWSTTRYPEMTIEYVRDDLYAALEAKLASLGPIADLLPDAVTAAEKAMVRYPQPNYVISKWAEETGEVTKDLIHEAFKAAIAKILPFAMKAKTQMLAAKVKHARKTCPECGGTVHFAIGGPRNHLHMACETAGCIMRMME